MDVDELLGGAIGGAVLELLKRRLIRQINVPDPVAGATWSQVVPAQTVWELLSVRSQLATSAAVATRFYQLIVAAADGSQVGRIAPGNSQVASLTNIYSWWEGLGYSNGNAGVTAALPVPAPNLLAGTVLSAGVSSLDVGDQLSGTVLMVREWRQDLVQANLDWIIGTLR